LDDLLRTLEGLRWMQQVVEVGIGGWVCEERTQIS
jgi:hypothetical protein